jgi:hypothetical protein
MKWDVPGLALPLSCVGFIAGPAAFLMVASW